MPLFLLFFLPLLSFAKVRTEELKEGTLYYDDKHEDRRPGIVIYPDTRGIAPFIRERARELAQQGYVAMTSRWSSNRTKARAALNELAGHEKVDSKQLVALGFGVGGTTALELARQKAPVQATISFYGDLNTNKPARAPFGPQVLVFHGDDDPFVPEKEVVAFQQEMQKAQAKWQIMTYGNTGHAFADPSVKSYNSFSAQRSWEQLLHFLRDLF